MAENASLTMKSKFHVPHLTGFFVIAKPSADPCSGQYFPLGAVLFTGSPSYAQTYAFVKSSGVDFDEFDPAFGYDYNPKTGAAALMQPPSPATAQALQEELARYAQVWQQKFAPYAVPGYRVSSFLIR